MLLLSLETSCSTFSVALHQGKRLIGFNEVTTPQSTASQLAVVIDQLISTSGYRPSQLSGVVVSSGPGSYTGLRIGVATAKGICFALQIPLLAINTLEVMAYQAKNTFFQQETKWQHKAFLCPMLDARRMEVYCLLANLELKIVEPTNAKVIDSSSFASALEENTIYFFGEGASKCRGVITHANAKFPDNLKPSAVALGEMGFAKFNQSAFENLATFEPYYLKDFLIRKPNLV